MKMVDVVGMTLLALAAAWVVMHTQHSFNQPAKIAARAAAGADVTSGTPVRTGKRILVKRRHATGTAAAETGEGEGGESAASGAGGNADGGDVATQDDAQTNDQESTELAVPLEMAQVAVAFVGVDPEANVVWDAAINDENESAGVRRGLIVGLDEEGFTDPAHLTTDDLALIESRMNVIEVEAPYAMDDVNDAAFQEAYRDLARMRERIMGR